MQITKKCSLKTMQKNTSTKKIYINHELRQRWVGVKIVEIGVSDGYRARGGGLVKKKLIQSWFQENGSFSSSFNEHYLSIPQYTGSLGNRFQEKHLV